VGAWNVGIYTNDDAMDFIDTFKELVKEYNIKEALEVYKKDNKDNYNYNECKLALAHTELFLTGKISNKDEILKLIDEELENESIETWNEDCREDRKQVLNKFKNEIKSNDNIEMVKDVNEWFYKIDNEDIL
jgi:hypothetical protein